MWWSCRVEHFTVMWCIDTAPTSNWAIKIISIIPGSLKCQLMPLKANINHASGPRQQTGEFEASQLLNAASNPVWGPKGKEDIEEAISDLVAKYINVETILGHRLRNLVITELAGSPWPFDLLFYFFYLHHRTWRRSCFTPFLFVCYLQNRRYFKDIGQSILLFCLSVCLFVTYRSHF